MAKYYKKHHKIACQYISHSIDLLKIVNTEIDGASFSDSLNKVMLFDSVGIPLEIGDINKQKAEVCLLAGEIYAKNKMEKKAIEAFQFYQLFISRIKSIDEEELLSFRNFNEYTLSDLTRNGITVCSPTVMNDPYDTLILKWGEFLKSKRHNKHIDYFCRSLDLYRIRSFVRIKGDDGNSQEMIGNVLMWSHYAGQHTGYCIKYHFSDKFLKQSSDSLTVRFRGMIYDNVEPLDIAKFHIDTNFALLKKHPLWQYENEVRLIAYNLNECRDFYQLTLDKDSYIDSIYFGCRCPDYRIDIIRKILDGQDRIKFYKMKSSYNDIYNMKPEAI